MAWGLQVALRHSTQHGRVLPAMQINTQFPTSLYLTLEKKLGKLIMLFIAGNFPKETLERSRTGCHRNESAVNERWKWLHYTAGEFWFSTSNRVSSSVHYNMGTRLTTKPLSYKNGVSLLLSLLYSSSMRRNLVSLLSLMSGSKDRKTAIQRGIIICIWQFKCTIWMKTSFVFIPRHFFFVSCHHESFSISNVSLIGAFVFCKCRRLIDFDAFDKQYLLWTIRRGKESRLNLRHHHGAVVVDIVNGSAACQAQLRKWTVNSKVYRRKLPLVLRKNVDECT